MVDTDFFVPSDKVQRFAANYDRGPDGRLRLIDDPETSRFLSPPAAPSGGGGLTGTARDYMRFCRMLLGGGAHGSERRRARSRVLRCPPMSDRGHRSVEHTADLAVELWAPDEPTLLAEGARALVELLTEGAAIHATAERTVELTALDASVAAGATIISQACVAYENGVLDQGRR